MSQVNPPSDGSRLGSLGRGPAPAPALALALALASAGYTRWSALGGESWFGIRNGPDSPRFVAQSCDRPAISRLPAGILELDL